MFGRMGVRVVRQAAANGSPYYILGRQASLRLCDRGTRRILQDAGVLHWTDEPRWSLLATPNATVEGIPLRVMNVYTGGVYVDNYLYFVRGQLSLLDPEALVWPPPAPAVVVVARYANTGLVRPIRIGDRDINLYGQRRLLALSMHTAGVAAIYGHEWPKAVGDKPVSNKAATLASHAFCLSLENTAWPHYCTEKMWQAVHAGTLPIYWGKGTRIYDDFPANSFVDASNFATPEELIAYLQRMEKTEYVDRVNMCRTVCNRIDDAMGRAGHDPWIEALRRMRNGLDEVRRGHPQNRRRPAPSSPPPNKPQRLPISSTPRRRHAAVSPRNPKR